MPRPRLGVLPFEPLMRASGEHLPHIAQLPRVLGMTTSSKPRNSGGTPGVMVGRVARMHTSPGNCEGLPMRVDDPIARLARRLRLTQRAVQRYARDGVPVSRADALCVLLNLNPIEVWGDSWWLP